MKKTGTTTASGTATPPGARDAAQTPAAEAVSVTLLEEMQGPCGPLPADLRAAYNLACSITQAVELILITARHVAADRVIPAPAGGAAGSVGGFSFATRELAARHRQGRSLGAVAPGPHRETLCRGIALNVEALRREFPHHGVLKGVTNELTVASEPASRFGHPNAHRAALALASRLFLAVWQHADPDEFTRALLDPGVRFDLGAIDARLEVVCEALAAAEWPDAGAIAVACEVEAAKAAAARSAWGAADYRPARKQE